MKSCCKIGTATGEICFNTGMTGYQDLPTLLTLTNYGNHQMHILGNYGVSEVEVESGSIK
jgi:carbamoyl-phosphate synthase small subunit